MSERYIEIIQENNHLEVSWADCEAIKSEYHDTFKVDEDLAEILVGINNNWRNIQGILYNILNDQND